MTKYQVGTDLGKDQRFIYYYHCCYYYHYYYYTLVARARFSIYKSTLFGLSEKDIQIFSTRKPEFPVNLHYSFPIETTYLIFYQYNYFTDLFNVI